MVLRRTLIALAVAVLLPYLWAPVYRFAPPHAFAGAHLFNPYGHLEGRWLRVNLHAHGYAWDGLTNGRQTDAEVVKAYRAHGYDLAGISDYFRIAAHDGVDTIPLYEHGLNLGKHHQVAIGARAVDWFDLPLWQDLSQKQYVINRVHASSDLVALAHPTIAAGGYSNSDLEKLTGYELFEVLNGRFPADHLWDVALSSGHAVWAIGDDDTHDVTAPDRMAVAWNMIDAASTSTHDIVGALSAGRTYAVLRPEGEPDASDAALSSLTLDGADIRVALTAPATIAFVGQNGRRLSSAANARTASYRLTPADTYVRTVVRTPHTVMYLNPVIRYDGGDWHAAPALVDPPRTWTYRAAILLACALLIVFGRRRPRRRSADLERLRRVSSFGILVAAAVGLAAPARAQGQSAPPHPSAAAVGEGPPLGSTLTFDLLQDLPTSANLFTVLETTQAEIISDRFTGGGLNYGTSARVGAFGSSWTQTIYRIGDVNVTDGAVSGAPLFFPEVAWWQQMTLASGIAPADVDAPGALITLEPRRPTATWTREASGSTSFGDALTGHGGSRAVPIQSPTGWNRASLVVSGPLVPDRAGIFFAGSWTGTSERDRANPTEMPSNVGSAFANLVFTPTDRDEVSTVGIVQRVSAPEGEPYLFTALAPARDDVSVHVQSTWRRLGDAGSGWRAFGSFTQRTGSDASPQFSSTTVDRVSDGPVPDMVSTGDRTDRRWTGGVRYSPPPRDFGNDNHAFQMGADVTGVSDDVAPGFSGSIGELVAGIPARVWQYAPGTVDMRHHATTASVFGADRIQLPSRLVIDASLRYEFVAGAADASGSNVRWNSVLPRAGLRFPVLERFGGSFFAAYARSAYQLPIDALSWGDPAAPTANIYQWTDPTAALPPATGALVGRWGPGTGGNPASSTIDPNLRRPYSDEVSFGIDAHPTAGTKFQLAAVGKWDRNLLGVVNRSTAAPLYATIGIPDRGADLANPADYEIIPVSNLVLNPGVPYGYNFQLTNPSDATSRLLAVKLSAEARTDRLFVLLGATAGLAQGLAGDVGFGPLENDAGVIGDAFVDPNAALFARGRMFNDRAFTIKLTTIYRFPWDIRLGAIARYQDGEPFSRLVVIPGLNQGAEAVRAFAAGGSRFTYTGTLDVRLQKGFAVWSHRLALVVDGYSIVNLGNEVEEDVLTGATFRAPTAIQPPPTLHVGLKVDF